MAGQDKIANWVIYKITSPSGRVYVGKTVDFKKRRNKYKILDCKRQPLLFSSFKKYGFENHTIDLIDSFDGNNDYADGKEMFWVRSFMSHKRKWENSEYKYEKGLNATDGGSGVLGNNSPKYSLRGRPLSEETKRKLSDSWKKKYENGFKHPSLGKKHSEERKKQIGLSKIGNKNCLGKKWSDERKKNFSKTRKRHPILQFDLNGNFIQEFESVRDAEKITKISRNVINGLLKGKTWRVDKRRKYTFEYKN